MIYATAVDAIGEEAACAEESLPGASAARRAESVDRGLAKIMWMIGPAALGAGSDLPKLTCGEINVLAGLAPHAFFRIAGLWSMAHDDQLCLLGIASPAILRR